MKKKKIGKKNQRRKIIECKIEKKRERQNDNKTKNHERERQKDSTRGRERYKEIYFF